MGLCMWRKNQLVGVRAWLRGKKYQPYKWEATSFIPSASYMHCMCSCCSHVWGSQYCSKVLCLLYSHGFVKSAARTRLPPRASSSIDGASTATRCGVLVEHYNQGFENHSQTCATSCYCNNSYNKQKKGREKIPTARCILGSKLFEVLVIDPQEP